MPLARTKSWSRSLPKSKLEPPTESGSITEKTERSPHWLLKAFLFCHVVAITSWALPKTPSAILNGTAKPTAPSEWLLLINDRYVKYSPIQIYMLSTGLWQSWDMFSPNPASSDIYSDADVTFKDGTVAHYAYPRMYALPILEKYVDERYRKFFEHANTDQDLYPFFAQRVARLASKYPTNPPIKVVLSRHWIDVPPLMTFDEYSNHLVTALKEKKLSRQVLLPDNPQVPRKYTDYVYYEYTVPPEAAKSNGK